MPSIKKSNKKLFKVYRYIKVNVQFRKKKKHQNKILFKLYL